MCEHTHIHMIYMLTRPLMAMASIPIMKTMNTARHRMSCGRLEMIENKLHHRDDHITPLSCFCKLLTVYHIYIGIGSK